MSTAAQETPIKSLLEEVIKTYTFTSLPSVTQVKADRETYTGTIHTDCALELSLSKTNRNTKTPKYDLHVEVYDVDCEALNGCLPKEQYIRLPEVLFPGNTSFSNDHDAVRIEYNKKTAEDVRTILKTTIPVIQALAPLLRKGNLGIVRAIFHGYEFRDY
ncbi:MAG: hypothetical protein AAB649_05435 [Patescibacteria group bacterium]